MHYLHELWGKGDKDAFKVFARNLNERQSRYDKSMLLKTWQAWMIHTEAMRKIHLEREQFNQTVEVLKNSQRGNRSTMEKEIIRRFVVQKVTCIPKSITFSEMDQLCNELDWYPLIGKSIVFLQGDFGNVYYMIARGRVGLYLEPSKDREMGIAREFGHLRGQPYNGPVEDLARLGNNIFNLPAGAGFGEYAILASTNKIRSCAAAAIDNDSLLLVMHADTYNAVLRQHHYRQKQLSSATSLLSELPLFRHHNYSKIASIAYTMRSQTYSSQSIIAKIGDGISNVLLIASGQVKVYAPPGQNILGSSSGDDDTGLDKNIAKRLPRLAVAMLGRGQIIGEVELHKHSRTFSMTYETCAASTEILEMPVTVFKEAMEGGEFKSSVLYKSLEAALEEKEQRRSSRITRAYDAMVKMVEGRTKEIKAKEEIMNILPVILDQTTLSGMTGAISSPNGGKKSKNVTSTSFNLASQTYDMASSPTSPRKANSLRSPRKLSFSSPVKDN